MKLRNLFKKKSFKLSLVFLSLLGMLASGGHSFAKYRDENYGGGNAGTAKFNFGEIIPVNRTIRQPTDKNELEQGRHLFEREFRLVIDEPEVSISYNVQLRLVSQDVTNFTAPSSGLSRTSFISNSIANEFYYFKVNSEEKIVTEQASLQEILGTSVEYSVGYWYYAVGTVQEDNSITYEWNKSNEFVYDINGNLTGAIPFDSGNVEAGDSLIKYFKIAIFVDSQIISTGNNQKSWSAENSKLMYNLSATQEEV